MKNKSFFSREDLNKYEFLDGDLKPGKYPFTRAIYEEMYSKKLWTMRQYTGFGNPEETNERFKKMIREGQTGLSLAFDLPTQLGLDPDHELSKGEVGRVGVSIWSVESMRRVLKDIDIDKISLSMTINATACILLAFYLAIAEERGIPKDQLRGTIQNDILKEFAARGNYIYPVKESMRLNIDAIEFSLKNLPNFYPISVSGYHFREKGANAVQEVAFTIADAIEYVKGTMERGIDPDTIGRRITFFFSSHNNFFEEIAKFRAARRVWAIIMKEKFGAKDEKAMHMRFHTQTAGSTLQAQHPILNIIRVSFQAMAAILGGTQSLHTNSFDEALSLPTDESALIALRTQQILAYETGLAEITDPLGGSFYVEALTRKIEEEVFSLLKEIEERGGAAECVEKGLFQKWIEENAYLEQKSIDEKKKIIVGLNAFKSEKDQKIKIFKIKAKGEKEEIKRIKEFKKKRDKRLLEEKLETLREKAQGKENLMDYIIDCVKANCTLGEISYELEKIWKRV
ncbi:MAG: methylmalonyl-CoA mutase family protein [Candidatus Hydrothermales bacterium]